jgi:hypothetical protein
MHEFSICETPGVMSYCQDSGSSDPYCSINVLVDGMPPQPGMTGPGIRLYAENEQQLRDLHAWLVERLQAQREG